MHNSNLPYPTASKSFLYFNAFMAKSGAQSLTFKSVTDRLTNKQFAMEQGTVPSSMPMKEGTVPFSVPHFTPSVQRVAPAE